MFRHLMTRLTLMLLTWADDPVPRHGDRSGHGRAGHGRADRGRADRGRSGHDQPDRGDVPGWVLITLMTAGLVVALWALAGEAFTTMFEDAMSKVRGAG